MFVLDLLLVLWLSGFDSNLPAHPPAEDGQVAAMDGGTPFPPPPRP